ncbi:MAG: hypothetical protein ACJ8AW_28690 [Rhodopila sp.]|jgi:hypothetical protein
MFGRLRAFIEKHILTEVPSELSACLDCGIEQCLNKDWETCPNRLSRAKALTALDQAAAARQPVPQEAETRPMEAAPVAVRSENQA